MNDFINSLMSLMVFLAPLIWIYLIFYTLNWNGRKNLFSDSWLVFIVLIISSSAVFFAFLIADANYYGFLHWKIPLLFLSILVVVDTFSVAAVLTYKENKRLISIAGNPNEETNQNTRNEKILLTSAIVTVLTIAMIGSLIMFVSEISTRIKESEPKSTYGIYD